MRLIKNLTINNIFIITIIILFIYTAIITAWLTDQSFITFRQLINLINYNEIVVQQEIDRHIMGIDIFCFVN